jgi:cytochrome c553
MATGFLYSTKGRELMRRIMMLAVVWWILPFAVFGAYHHGGDTDSDVVLQVYPEIEGTKLDSCALCHSGGEYTNSKGKEVSLGSCQWCHYSFGYDESGDIDQTLNGYGKAYREKVKELGDQEEVWIQTVILLPILQRSPLCAIRETPMMTLPR